MGPEAGDASAGSAEVEGIRVREKARESRALELEVAHEKCIKNIKGDVV